MPSQRLTVNLSKVVHETIDNEVIIINLESGAYYHLVESGVDVWRAVEKGATREEILRTLLSLSNAEASEVEVALDNLIEELKAEQVVAVEDAPDGDAAPAPDGTGIVRGDRPLGNIGLAKYTNMADLLLLDPIHDVDEQGWPKQRTE